MAQTLTDTAVVHAVAGVALPLVAVIALVRSERTDARRLSFLGALLSSLTLVTGVLRIRAWEPGYRRAVYVVSHTAGEWLDRKTHLGFAACCFALAAAAATFDRDAPLAIRRLLWSLTLAFSIAALLVLVYVHARVPNAMLG